MLAGGRTLGVVAVGCGYWGPNVVRNTVERPELELLALCELDASNARRFSTRHPGIRTVSDYDAVLADARVDAICVATPPRTHHALVRKALLAGKHVLVVKPLATNVRDAEELVALAEERGLTLMPGHTFLYSPPVNKIKRLIASGDVGEIYFVTSSRMNLGIYQSDGVVSDRPPHDLTRSTSNGSTAAESPSAHRGARSTRPACRRRHSSRSSSRAARRPTYSSPGSRRARCAR
jgi:predicted dehydrogenase